MQTHSDKSLSASDLEGYTTESEETMDLLNEFKARLRILECKFNMKSVKDEDQYARDTTVDEKPAVGESPVVERPRPLSTLLFGASAPAVSGFDTPSFP
ncbi:hypothetical protein FGIG_01617 [Fasciola gigantica]|uniref:Uncharacterized protein n=1 Tax=Fasciola gigantica TaxID=46835 RepID=A0A504Y8H4_FASGI|nr:hypothetical protein FGIG_01617 [Fasciola gigantica]